MYLMQLVQKVEVTRAQNMSIYHCQTACKVSLFVGFLISSISLPTKTTKIGRQRITLEYLWMPPSMIYRISDNYAPTQTTFVMLLTMPDFQQWSGSLAWYSHKNMVETKWEYLMSFLILLYSVEGIWSSYRLTYSLCVHITIKCLVLT